ncbi:MAG: hypothetical protein Q9161_007422 [Pseudevernia consocians]
MAQSKDTSGLPAVHLSGSTPRQEQSDEYFRHGNSVDLEDPTHVDWPQRKERALVRKIDRKLLPILSLIYIMAFLDRYGFRDQV